MAYHYSPEDQRRLQLSALENQGSTPADRNAGILKEEWKETQTSHLTISGRKSVYFNPLEPRLLFQIADLQGAVTLGTVQQRLQQQTVRHLAQFSLAQLCRFVLITPFYEREKRKFDTLCGELMAFTKQQMHHVNAWLHAPCSSDVSLLLAYLEAESGQPYDITTFNLSRDEHPELVHFADEAINEAKYPTFYDPATIEEGFYRMYQHERGALVRYRFLRRVRDRRNMFVYAGQKHFASLSTFADVPLSHSGFYPQDELALVPFGRHSRLNLCLHTLTKSYTFFIRTDRSDQLQMQIEMFKQTFDPDDSRYGRLLIIFPWLNNTWGDRTFGDYCVWNRCDQVFLLITKKPGISPQDKESQLEQPSCQMS